MIGSALDGLGTLSSVGVNKALFRGLTSPGDKLDSFIGDRAKKYDKYNDKGIPNRIALSLLGLSAGMIIPAAIGLSGGKIKVSQALVSSAIGASGGYFAPDVYSAIKNKDDEAMKTIAKKSLYNPLEKTSGLYGATDAVASKAFKALYDSIIFKKNRSPVSKALSLGVKGAIGYSAVKGAKEFVDKKTVFGGPMSSNNYTTALRNNLLAGRIDPTGVHVDDLKAVKALGMR